jgi:hypothetical protein
MEYVLTREGSADEPRIREIHTPDEVVHPTWTDGIWTAIVKTGSASTALQSRRYGFALVEERHEARDFALPEHPPWRRGVEAFIAAGLVIHDAEPPPAGPVADWERWRARRRQPPRPIQAGDLWRRLRAKVDPHLLQRASEVARSGVWNDPDGESVGIVKVFHGWGPREEAAVARALDAAAALGPESWVVVVQNDERAHEATRSWQPRANWKRLSVVLTPNNGFAAACNAGAKAASGVRWLVFTQPDAVWDQDAVRDAVGLSLSLKAAPTGFGAPAVIGPSGGYVDDPYDGGIREFGRNVRVEDGTPAPVDWLAGYWLLVDAATFRKAGGWCERFFLYYEDPDLSLRLALAGSRPFAWPGLAVEHERGGTIRARIPDAIVSRIQGESRATFGARWGGR